MPAAPGGAGLDVGLAQVEQRVEVAERLGDGLDALPVHAGVGVQGACLVVVAGGVGVGERLGAGDERAHLVLDVGDVLGVGGGDLVGGVAGRSDLACRSRSR